MSNVAPDLEHMRRAIQLAERGQGHVEPNPMVGCVIVRDGREVGEGWHRITPAILRRARPCLSRSNRVATRVKLHRVLGRLSKPEFAAW